MVVGGQGTQKASQDIRHGRCEAACQHVNPEGYNTLQSPGICCRLCSSPPSTPPVWYNDRQQASGVISRVALISTATLYQSLVPPPTPADMSAKHDDETKVVRAVDTEASPPPNYDGASVQDDQAYVYDDSQKLGYTATVFVILNKMIGTGSVYRFPYIE
jgi:hypothetical protein